MIDLTYEWKVDIAILLILVIFAIILGLAVFLVRRSSMKAKSSDKKLVNELLLLTPATTKYDLWKYFEDRADRLRERLWTTGTWLVTILIAVLALPFTVKFIQVEVTKPLTFRSVVQSVQSPIPLLGVAVQSVQSPIPLLGVAVFGLAFSVYAWFVLRDL